MADLSTVEKYALAQILVCGEIDEQEFKNANDYSGSLQNEVINNLWERGILQDYTLYCGGRVEYREQ